jgi:hypothetical protein
MMLWGEDPSHQPLIDCCDYGLTDILYQVECVNAGVKLGHAAA